METTAVDERARFARDVVSGQWSMTELCERHGVTRPTGYKWVARYRAGGDDALTDRSRAPHHSPHRTAADLETLVLAARQQYGWGARKLLQLLRTRHPTRAWPARSTLNALLDRHGLLRKQRRPRRWAHPGAAPVQTDAPNQVWPADFKGQFKTGDGRYCYPLTVTDHFSRALLVCRGLPSVRTACTQPRVSRAVSRDGLARRDPHRQWRAVRVDRHPRPLAVECLVDATGDRPSAHPAGQSAGERAARTDASRAETGDRPSGRRHGARPAASLRCLPPALQHRAPARRDWRSDPGLALDGLDAPLSRAHPAAVPTLTGSRLRPSIPEVGHLLSERGPSRIASRPHDSRLRTDLRLTGPHSCAPDVLSRWLARDVQ